jgi:hypothetical protein
MSNSSIAQQVLLRTDLLHLVLAAGFHFTQVHRFAHWDIPRNLSLRFAHEESAQSFLSYRTTMAKEMVLPSFLREESMW